MSYPLISEIESRKISQLENRNKLEKTDIVEFERDVFDNVWKKIVHNTYQISCSDFADSISSQMNLNLSSMAYENKYNYSPINNKHDYSYVVIKPNYSENENEIATFNITGIRSSEIIKVYNKPDSEQKIVPLYKVGDIRMFINKTKDNNSTSTPDFDGWVYTDGARYNRRDFPEAYELFKTLDGSDDSSFVVPKFNSFFRANPGNITNENQLSSIPYKNMLPEHTHTSADFSQISSDTLEQKLTLKLDSALTGISDGKRVHEGFSGTVQSYLSVFSINVLDSNVKFTFNRTSNPIFNGDTLTETETYPKHVLVQSMVYIGRKNA